MACCPPGTVARRNWSVSSRAAVLVVVVVRSMGGSFTRERVACTATLSEIQGDGPVRFQAQSGGLLAEGLPSENTPPDCPDTSLQCSSRHWITSFRWVTDRGSVAQILCLSKEITQPLRQSDRPQGGTAAGRLDRRRSSPASPQRPRKPRTGQSDRHPEGASPRLPRTHHFRVRGS